MVPDTNNKEAPLARKLRRLLRLDGKSPGRLSSRENSRLEFKESFNWGNRARYARTMAAFANNVGGFVVFGVKDSPHELVGLASEGFDRIDSAKVAGYLNSTFAPELAWEMFALEMEGVRLGAIAVEQAVTKPVVCMKGGGKELQEAEIYYRYRGRSERIRYPELERIIGDRLRRDREAFMKHLRRIDRLGPENIGVLDLAGGELTGSERKLLLGDDLVSELRVIREGQFAEVDETGTPTLRLVGDVHVVDSGTLRPVRAVVRAMAIGEKDIMLGFLRQERPDSAVEYLRQACREASLNMPIYHFARVAGIGPTRLGELVVAEKRGRKRLLGRVKGATIAPLGSLKAATVSSSQRLEVLEALENEEEDGFLCHGVQRLFEAITHYRPSEAPRKLKKVLADLVQAEFDGLGSNQRSMCRKAVAHLDEVLNRDAWVGAGDL